MVELDFTLKTLEKLYRSLLCCNYRILTFLDFLQLPQAEGLCILRHDIDKGINYILPMAEMENSLGIKSTYFFRYKEKIADPEVILKVKDLGHEIGYHYEVLTKAKGNYEKAVNLFKAELDYFRKIAPIKTISAHGSPLSKYDDRDLWRRYNLKNFDLAGDACISTNFDKVLYITDTGRGWNRDIGNVRDKVTTGLNRAFRSTYEIIDMAEDKKLPDRIMLNIHPHRWSRNLFQWTAELIDQNIKNLAKAALVNRWAQLE